MMITSLHDKFAQDTHVFRYAQQLGWAPSEELRARHNKAMPTSPWGLYLVDSLEQVFFTYYRIP